MKFTPKTEEEIAAQQLWPEGIYTFMVLDSGMVFGKLHFTEDCKSSAGNDMIKIVMAIYNDDREQIIMDFLMADYPKKLRQICYALGLGDSYERGDINPEQFVGKCGELKLIIGNERKSKDGLKTFAAKNEVNSYLAKTSPTNHDSITLDDKVPF